MSLQVTSPEEARYRIQFRRSPRSGSFWYYIDELKTTWYGKKYWKTFEYETRFSAAEQTLREVLIKERLQNETHYYK